MLSASLLVEKGNSFQGKTSFGSDTFPSKHHAPLMSSPSPRAAARHLKTPQKLKHLQDPPPNLAFELRGLVPPHCFYFWPFFFFLIFYLRDTFSSLPKLKVGAVHVVLRMLCCFASAPCSPFAVLLSGERRLVTVTVKRSDRALQTKVTSTI